MTTTTASDLQSFRDLADRLAQRELAPGVIERDDYPFVEFRGEALAAAAETGVLSLMLPEEHGGAGQGLAALSEVLGPLARADASFATLVFVHTLAQAALARWGGVDTVKHYAAVRLIGFPVYDLPTDLPGDLSAEPSGDGWKLSGAVAMVALAPVAEAMIVPARVSGEDRTALFILDITSAGVSVGEALLSLGLRHCPVADVGFDGVEVRSGALLCPDAGAEYPRLAARFRSAAAALSLGVMEGSYEAAKAYAKERYQGGRNIIEYDQVRLMLVNMAVMIEAGKPLVRAMAQAADDGRSWPMADAGMVLLGDQAARATTDGVQVLGGYGYMQDYGQEKRMRDAKQIQMIFGSAPQKRLELMDEILRQEE